MGDDSNCGAYPGLKALCVALQGVAAGLLLLTAVGWFYLEQIYNRPEASTPTPAHPFLLYLNNIPVYTTPILGTFYEGAPYVCMVLIVLVSCLNVITKKVDLEKLMSH